MGGRKREAGITLIEVIITLVILAVVALALANGLLISIQATSVTEERAAAIRAAREKLEWVVAMKSAILNAVPSQNLGNQATPPPAVYPWFEIANTPGAPNYGVILAAHFDTDPTHDQKGTFGVSYARKSDTNAPGTQVFLQGINGADAGEIVVMFDETAQLDPVVNPYRTLGYGRDLTDNANPQSALADGVADGVNFVQIDCDLDGKTGAAGTPDVRIPCSKLDLGTQTPGAGRVPVGVIIRWRGADGQLQRVEQWTVVNFTPMRTDMITTN